SHPREKSGLQFLQGKAELLAKFVHDEKPLPVVFLADTTRSEDRLLVPSFSSPAPRALPPGAFTARATCPFNSYPHDPPQSGNAPVLLTHMQLAMGARQGTEAEDLTSTLVRLGARKLIEELLEAETSDILGGRGRYERRHADQQGLRNGYKRRHIDCAEGRLEIEVPQIRGVQGVCLLSHASVSRLSEQLWEEYEAFSERDLSGFDVVYLFADGVYESVRQQAG